MQVANHGTAGFLWLPILPRTPLGPRHGDGMGQVATDIADQVDEREVPVAKPPPAPAPAHTLEAVMVAAGDDRLQGPPFGLLQHGVVAAARRRAGVLVDLDDRVGRHVLGSRCSVVHDDQRLPDRQQAGPVNRVPGANLDARVLEERRRARQVAGVDAFGVAIEEVGDLRLGPHAVKVALPRDAYNQDARRRAPKLSGWANSTPEPASRGPR